MAVATILNPFLQQNLGSGLNCFNVIVHDTDMPEVPHRAYCLYWQK